MKNLLLTVLVAFVAIPFTGCYDRDIVDSKEFPHSLPKVENLNYTKQQSSVRLNWQIPQNISPAFRRPLEVSIQKIENGIYKEIIIVGAEGITRDVAITPDKKYRFVVKLAGYLTDDAKEKGKSDRVYSDGQIVEIE